MINTHTCLDTRCGAQYQDEDTEPGFCPETRAQRAEVAAEIDRKRAALGKPEKGMSELEMYDALKDGRGFARASDLGISIV